MIQTQAQLGDFLNLIKDETELAIDTEFKWVSTYFPQFCLLQIATKNAAECIDILALEDLKPLFDKLYQPNVLWIAHAARNDIEVLFLHSKRLPEKVFDTQIAVDLLKNLRPEDSNFGSQISYQELTQILQNITLDKSLTRLDWTTRPLPDKAIEYALNDVIYLLKNYYKLKILLENEQKLNWQMQEGAALLDINLYEIDIFQAWNRVKGFSRLPAITHTFAAELAAWREFTAINKNKPRKWIISDEDLLDIASGKRDLSDKNQLSFDKFLSNNPNKIQPNSLNSEQKRRETPSEKSQKQCLQKLIEGKANQYNLTKEIFANNKSLLKYIRGNDDVIFMRGWRYHLLQKELEQCKTV